MTYVTFPAQTVRHTLPDASDASTRAFTLQSQAAANRSRPLRTPPDGLSVPDEPDAVDAVCTRATRREPFANGTRVG